MKKVVRGKYAKQFAKSYTTTIRRTGKKAIVRITLSHKSSEALLKLLRAFLELEQVLHSRSLQRAATKAKTPKAKARIIAAVLSGTAQCDEQITVAVSVLLKDLAKLARR